MIQLNACVHLLISLDRQLRSIFLSLEIHISIFSAILHVRKLLIYFFHTFCTDSYLIIAPRHASKILHNVILTMAQRFLKTRPLFGTEIFK
jgi:hypothetical protein